VGQLAVFAIHAKRTIKNAQQTSLSNLRTTEKIEICP